MPKEESKKVHQASSSELDSSAVGKGGTPSPYKNYKPKMQSVQRNFTTILFTFYKHCYFFKKLFCQLISILLSLHIKAEVAALIGKPVRLIVPFCQQFRVMGIKGRATGVSRDEAMKRVAQFRSENFLTSIQGKATFAGRTYDDDRNLSLKERKAMEDAIEGTYLDGYEGWP